VSDIFLWRAATHLFTMTYVTFTLRR
jgi:hypothetical protein